MNDYEYDDLIPNDEELMHYGVGHLDGGNSGRWPWGSGDKPFQNSGDFYSRVQELKKQGLTQVEIAKYLDMTTTQLRSSTAIARNQIRANQISYIKTLQKQGITNRVEIGKRLGEQFNPDKSPIGESTVRSLLNAESESRMNAAELTYRELKKIVDEKEFVDVGTGTEAEMNNGLGISSTKFNQALDMLYMDGYEILTIRQEQLTNPGFWTPVKVLAKPGTTYPEVYKAREENKIKPIVEYKGNITRDDGRPKTFIYPESLDSKRLKVRYAEEGGINKDGLVELRRNVKDLSLGDAPYSQVRILVDGTHYIKGMAVYGRDEDFPEGVDVIFNSNKSKSVIGDDIHDALKSISKNIDKDPMNPFGSTIKDINGQSFYDDPNGKYIDPITGNKQSLSLINKRSDAGDWDAWAKQLPSQFLSKQPLKLINRQIKQSEDEKQAEFDEIMSLTNPTVKRHLLEEFADDCDSASVHLKTASLPGQSYKVILPLVTMNDKEVYAPTLENGTRVALIRFPHGGTFEIPILTVNNRNQEGKDALTTNPVDAIGINSKVAEQLSGADFDGDTVMMIPLSPKINISSRPPLRELVGFDPKFEYGADPGSEITINGVDYASRNGVQFRRMTNTQNEMGRISNLITDMTLKGASPEELARAVKHSMVVIDAEKHFLDYKASEQENRIQELKDIYQSQINPENGKKHYGASTLISKSKSEFTPLEREQGAYFTKDKNERVELIDPENKIYENKETGEMFDSSKVRKLMSDPNTGEKVYTYTNRVYTLAKYRDYEGKIAKASVYEKNGMQYYKKAISADEKVETPLTTEEVIIKSAPNRIISTKMAEVSDAHQLVSFKKTPQEEAYADYANKLKSLANQARKETYLIEDIPYSAEARIQYQEQCDSLEYKLNASLRNKPKERQAQIIAETVYKARLQEDPGMDDDHRSKLRQTALKNARVQVGAAREEIYIDDKEWEAIQAGAISKTMLKKIMLHTNSDRLKQLAMPRKSNELTPTMINRIKARAKTGYTTSEIAKALGISVSTVNKYLLGKE